MGTEELLVEVAELLRRPGERRRHTGEHHLSGLALSAARVPDSAGVSFDLILESLTDGIVVTGSISVPWVGECRRCSEEIGGTVVEDVREVFSARPIEGETYPLGGHAIDLAPMLREVALLGLPVAPVCDLGPSCPNLRGSEGVSFFEVGSGGASEGPSRDPRWAALDELHFGPEAADS